MVSSDSLPSSPWTPSPAAASQSLAPTAGASIWGTNAPTKAYVLHANESMKQRIKTHVTEKTCIKKMRMVTVSIAYTYIRTKD